MKRKCPPGKYYCYTDKKCKKIPKGFKVVGRMGYLRRENGFSKDENETKKNGNGSSNGNGNGGNGAGNGNGGSGGNGGGNGGGGMGESIIYEKSNPRIPRKAGQPAKSKKHSDLYTDEDPKGTIHGLGFKNVAKARASVSKIRNSSRSHAHKIQAAVAMEQRAREMGKTSEAAIYRKYINSMKKKTKRMNEAVNAAQQAAIAIDMKKKGKKPKSMKEGMYNHTDVGLITNAVVELEDGLKTLKTITYDSVDQLMQGIAKRNDISPTLLHNQFKAKHFTIPDNWAIRYRMNKMKGIEEATMTPAQKRKDTMLKKKYDKSDMKKSMQKQYGKEEGKKVYFATIRKQAMSEMALDPLKKAAKALARKQNRIKPKRQLGAGEKMIFDRQKKELDQTNQIIKPKVTDVSRENKLIDKYSKKYKTPQQKTDTQQKLRDMARGEYMDDDYKYNVSEEGLRDWFGKSSGTTKSGRKVRGWVQVGGKYDGKPCARQPGQKSTPKCVSSAKRRSMSKSERDSAARRKRAADPNQPQKSGAAKPTNVSTDPKKKMSENYFNEAKDKKGKGSGTKDACYHKVKSRYSVWPSAYASGALVKCRKVGAANWGNKSKNEGFSPMQVAALEAAGMIEIKEGKKCWKGYKKAGTQKLFGKTYNRCVKAGDELNHDGQKLNEADLPDFKDKLNQQSAARNEVKKKLNDLKQQTSGTPQNPEVTKVTRSQNKNMKNVTSKMQRVGDAVKRVGKKVLGMEDYAPVTEGVAFLKREKEKKKSKPSVSTYVSKSKSDAGNRAAKIMRDKEQRKYVGFLPANEEKDLTNESKTRLVKNGHTYKVVLIWRGKTYMVQMFVPSVSRPTRQEVEKQVQKLYPDAKVMSFLPRDLEPGEPTVMMGEEKRDEYGDIVGGPKISKKQKAKNLAKNEKDEKITRSEEYINELKTRTMLNYIDKASDSASKELNKAKKTTSRKKEVKARLKMDQRERGIEMAKDKIMKRVKEENINELSLDTLSKAARQAMSKREAARGTSEFVKRQRQTEKFTNAAVKKRRSLDATKEKLGKTFKGPDADRTPTMEEFVSEDDMKGMSVKSGHKRPTKSGAGMTAKGVAAYRRRNPGSKLQTAVTGKVKKGSKDAKRRKSYCARSAGQMKKFPKAAKDPNSRLRQARRRWKC